MRFWKWVSIFNLFREHEWEVSFAIQFERIVTQIESPQASKFGKLSGATLSQMRHGASSKIAAKTQNGRDIERQPTLKLPWLVKGLPSRVLAINYTGIA